MAPQSGIVSSVKELDNLKLIQWEEISSHKTKEDKWIVVDDLVYNVSTFHKRHPGGARIISHFAGQDASDVWHAMHIDKNYVAKFMKPLLIGRVQEAVNKEKSALQNDFRALRDQVEEMGLFHSDPKFFMAHLAHIIFLEVAAVWLLWFFGCGWLPWLATACVLATAQAQTGWSQHDYGHMSVFKTSKMNHIAHHFFIGILKGASSHWWNFRHHQHHAKPNVVAKDPDITLPYLYMLGDKMPLEWGKRRKGFMPYNWQHGYFWALGPAILLPIYFHLENIYFVIKRRDVVDLLCSVVFFVRIFSTFVPFLGGWGTFWLYMFARFIESHWFTFVTQMNHLPMEIDRDQKLDWVTSQTIATCNVHPSAFNDWFTGHLNFQIEHHLFPTMPRHNYCHVKPLVESLCRKHNVTYTSKPLGTAFADILRSLKKSGQLWYDAYYHQE